MGYRSRQSAAPIPCNLEKLAAKIKRKLLDEGFVVQLLHADSGSIYLRLDYGLANSIRLSNHNGRNYLNYKYNLLNVARPEMKRMREISKQNAKFKRYFYVVADQHEMLNDIISSRNAKLEKFGNVNYGVQLEQLERDTASDLFNTRCNTYVPKTHAWRIPRQYVKVF